MPRNIRGGYKGRVGAAALHSKVWPLRPQMKFTAPIFNRSSTSLGLQWCVRLCRSLAWPLHWPPPLPPPRSGIPRTNPAQYPETRNFRTLPSHLSCVLVFLHNCVLLECASGCVVEWRICNREVAGSNLGLGYFAPRSTQPSISPGSVNEYQLRLGRQRQVWLIPIADEIVTVQVKL